MSQIDIFDEIIVDNFAGGGGASTGIELAAGRPVAIAINHDPDAILLHKTNHPYTEHARCAKSEGKRNCKNCGIFKNRNNKRAKRRSQYQVSALY